MKIKYDVPLPERRKFSGGKKSEEILAIEDFVKGTKKNMSFEYDSPQEAKKRLAVISGFRRKDPLGDLIDAYRNDKNLYIVRLDPKTVKERKEARNLAAQKN